MLETARNLREGLAASEKGRRRADEILDAAAAILTSGGAENFSMNRVAAEAGISLGNLQYYFSKRTDLIEALLERQVEQLHSEISRVLSASERDRDGGEMLRTSIDYVLQMNENASNCAIVWNAYAMARYNKGVQKIVDRWLAVYVQTFADLVEEANPALSSERRDQISRHIVCALEGEAVLAFSLSSTDRAAKKAFMAGFTDMVMELVAA